MNNYFSIKTHADIETFIEKTNALHDGYIVAVEFKDKGIKPTDHGYEFDWMLRRLKIRVLITSIYDAVLEMVFENVLEWKITESREDIFEVGLGFDDKGLIIWTDDSDNMALFGNSKSYVLAKKMKWRIL